MPELIDQPREIRGDTKIRGFRSRPDPTELPDGIARYLENMRCNDKFRPRAGTVALATDLELVVPPAVLDFDLPTELSVSSMTRVGATVTVTTSTAHGYTTGDIVGIEGASQTDYNGDWEISVTGGSTFTFDIGAATPATPATGTIVCAKGIRIYEIASDRVRAACVYVEDDLTQRVLIAAGNKAYVYRSGLATVEIDYPTGEIIDDADEADLLAHLDKVYLFRGASAGDDVAISSVTRAGSTVTVTTTAAHGLASNDWVRMIGQSAEDYRGVYQITVTGGSTFTYDIGAAVPASPATTAGVCYKCKPVLVWDRSLTSDFVTVTTGTMPSTGHIRMPPADWGVAFNRQLILPYGRDEHILSGFGVDDDFDTLLSQARIRPGGPDWLVAIHPAARTRYLVLYRNSLHRVQRNVSDLTIEDVDEVPSGVGCVSRKTVVTCGDFIAWLSDRGVQLLSYVDQLNLVTAKEPLSAEIDDLIQRINWAYADRAVAAYHDNRYFLAVPMDDSDVNNRVLVFNFLNRSSDSPLGEWESIDVYPGDFDIAEMLILDYEGRQCLHYLTTLGGLYVAHQGEQDEYGAPGSTLGSYDIAGIVRGRRHLFGNLETKRFLSASVSCELEAGAQVQVIVATVNPDSERTVRDHTAATTEDKLLAVPLRSRGESGAIDLLLPVGRPAIRAMTLKAIIPGEDTRDKE